MFRSKTNRARTRRNLYCSTALALILSSAASAHASKTKLDIPPQPLASALQAFSLQTNSQVLFSDEFVAGREAPPLRGEYSLNEALAVLVRGTGLSVEQSSDRVFLVKPSES